MPLYEYKCQDCGDDFELLVTASTQPRCPSCGSEKLEKQFSTFSASGASAGSGGSGHVHSAGCGCGRPQGSCGLN